jgi:hypothetical protein
MAGMKAGRRTLSSIATILAVLSFSVVSHPADASFQDQEIIAGIALSSGAFNLTTSDPNGGLFPITALHPGDSITFDVTVNNTAKTAIRFTGTGGFDSLGEFLILEITTAGGESVYSGRVGSSDRSDTRLFGPSADTPRRDLAAGASEVFKVTVSCLPGASAPRAGVSTSLTLMFAAKKTNL